MAGAALAFVLPGSACIMPDQCALIYSMGKNWCAPMYDAMRWPQGHPELAEPIWVGEFQPPQGCTCVNDVEHEILEQQVPTEAYVILRAEIEAATRENCLLLSIGFASNCLLEQGPDAPTIDEEKLREGLTGPCVGGCGYALPPLFGECPDDPDPFACEELVDPGSNDEADDGACPIGAEDCPCTVGGSCDDNLECVDGTCLPLPSDEEADDGTDIGPIQELEITKGEEQ